MSEMIGRVLEGYRIEAELGRGGQAIVYRATQLSLQRTVALKVVSPQLSSDENFKERFTREGIAAASLDHPHVIPVFEAGEADGLAFLAMKFVDGPSMDAVIHQPGGIEARRTVAILRQVALALDYMAQRGMVHRDVKPANILLGPGDHAYLSDFGLIKAISASRLTSSGVWMGTFEYVAPEQIRGTDITPAADRYALAALAFEALTGRVLFPRDDRTATLFAHLNDQPPAASSLHPALGPAVDPVLAQALAKNATDRHPTAVEFIDQLAAALAATPGAADSHPRPAATPPPPPPPMGDTVTGLTPADPPATAPPGPRPPLDTPAPPPAAPSDPPAPPPATDPATSAVGATASGGNDTTRTLMIVGGAAAAIVVLVVAVLLISSALGGGDSRTVTVASTTTTQPTVSTPQPPPPPGNPPLGAVLPTALAGWVVSPTDPAVPNLPDVDDSTVEVAQFLRGNEIALVMGIAVPDGVAADTTLNSIGASLGGDSAEAPQLGPEAGRGFSRTVRDGTAVAFTAGPRVVLILSAEGATAQGLATALSGG